MMMTFQIPGLGPMVACSVALSGCTMSTADISSVRMHAKEAPIVYSSPVRNNVTPLDKALACAGDKLKARRGKPIGIAVGDVKDYTGKQGQDEGYAITQGGALMAYSALGKMRGGVRIHERFDTRITEAELTYMNQRQLGDGEQHRVDDASGKSMVSWKPYYGGSILQSDYFIVGGITELNYNIQSGGGEVAVSSVGPKARIYTMNVAVDLRIVGSQSLMVYDTVSVEKQLTGYEVGVGVFRFFGNNLFDVNIGAKNQEPLQLGVRMAIEMATLQLIASVAQIDPSACIPSEFGPSEWDGANVALARRSASETATEVAYAGTATAARPTALSAQKADRAITTAAVPAAKAIYELEPVSEAAKARPARGGAFSIVFAEGSDQLDEGSKGTMLNVGALVRDGRDVDLTLSSSGGASGAGFDETMRNSRIQSVVAALLQQGISRGQARLVWQASTASAPPGDASGAYEIARLRIG